MADDKVSQIELMRRFMPRQFTKMTKLCAKCGGRVQFDDDQRVLLCTRCRETY